LPEIKKGNTIGHITCGGIIEEIIVCDAYGDEIDIESLSINQSGTGVLKAAVKAAREELIKEILAYATDFYSMYSGDFQKKYPSIKYMDSDGQWIASFLQQLKGA
jgi:hypothetical protein